MTRWKPIARTTQRVEYKLNSGGLEQLTRRRTHAHNPRNPRLCIAHLRALLLSL